MIRNPKAYLVLGLVVIIGGIAIFAGLQTSKPATNTRAKYCADEVKLCPDGTTVSRKLPSCNFTACPTSETTDLTKDWKDYSDADWAFSLKYPPTWTVTKTETSVIVAGSDVTPLIITRVEDDTELYQTPRILAITIDGIAATQADGPTADGTTRTIWIDRNGTWLRLSWRQTGNDAPYNQILTTVKLQ